MATSFSCEFLEGGTWIIDIACKGFDGAALDITLHTKKLRLARKGVTAIDISGIAADANIIDSGWATGLLRFKVLPAGQSAIVPGQVYDAEISTVAADGTVYLQAKGTVHVPDSILT